MQQPVLNCPQSSVGVEGVLFATTNYIPVSKTKIKKKKESAITFL